MNGKQQNFRSLENLLMEAEDDNLLPELHNIIRNTPKYDISKVIKLSDVKDYFNIIEKKYLKIKYKDGKMYD